MMMQQGLVPISVCSSLIALMTRRVDLLIGQVEKNNMIPAANSGMMKEEEPQPDVSAYTEAPLIVIHGVLGAPSRSKPAIIIITILNDQNSLKKLHVA
jgi:hypothetical protein